MGGLSGRSPPSSNVTARAPFSSMRSALSSTFFFFTMGSSPAFKLAASVCGFISISPSTKQIRVGGGPPPPRSLSRVETTGAERGSDDVAHAAVHAANAVIKQAKTVIKPARGQIDGYSIRPSITRSQKPCTLPQRKGWRRLPFSFSACGRSGAGGACRELVL